MIDVHCHLTFSGLNEIKDKLVVEAKKSMKAIITCGLSRDYEQSLELAKKYPGFVYAYLGIHPEDIVDMRDEQVEGNLDFIRNHVDDIVAVKTGLDFYWVKEENQIERTELYFQKCLDLAKEIDLPVVVHSRNAEEEVFNTLVENKVRHAVFHHFSGNMTLAKQIIENGYYLSIPTIIETSKNLKKIGKNFPLDMLMTETDSPFNSPTKDKTNYPYNVKLTIEKIAELRNSTFEEIDKTTTENAIEFFNLT